MSWQWRMMQKLKTIRGIWRNLTWALGNLKNLHFNRLFLIKVYNFWAKKVQKSYIWYYWILMQNLKENWLMPSQTTWRILQIFVYTLKNSNFTLESKMAELNQNKNSKPPDRPETVWKLYFTLEMNE